jgi:hypothetical protein
MRSSVSGDAGLHVGQHARPPAGRLGHLTFARGVLAGLVERHLQLGAGSRRARLLGLLDRDVAALHQRLGVELAHAAPSVDALYMSGWV